LLLFKLLGTSGRAGMTRLQSAAVLRGRKVPLSFAAKVPLSFAAVGAEGDLSGLG